MIIGPLYQVFMTQIESSGVLMFYPKEAAGVMKQLHMWLSRVKYRVRVVFR